MTDHLPPSRHPADAPWWRWNYVGVRRWARMRRHSRFVFGSIMAASYVAVLLVIRQFALGWGYDPISVGGVVLGGVFFGIFSTLLWNWTERRYLRALERRAAYDADRERSTLAADFGG
jgi:hypothetical protein